MSRQKSKILFLCTGNSCRSQMAEGYAKALLGNVAEITSAGIEAHGINPRAVQCMQADGIDITSQQSNRIDNAGIATFDHIITLCGDAKDRCPRIPAATRHDHWDLIDPARKTGSEAEITQTFIEVRDKIKRQVMQLKEQLAVEA